MDLRAIYNVGRLPPGGEPKFVKALSPHEIAGHFFGGAWEKPTLPIAGASALEEITQARVHESAYGASFDPVDTSGSYYTPQEANPATFGVRPDTQGVLAGFGDASGGVSVCVPDASGRCIAEPREHP